MPKRLNISNDDNTLSLEVELKEKDNLFYLYKNTHYQFALSEQELRDLKQMSVEMLQYTNKNDWDS